MAATDNPDTKSLSCPHCGGELTLKKTHEESVIEYFFTCLHCAIEYTNDRIEGESQSGSHQV
jgi:hypothetical protein